MTPRRVRFPASAQEVQPCKLVVRKSTVGNVKVGRGDGTEGNLGSPHLPTELMNRVMAKDHEYEILGQISDDLSHFTFSNWKAFAKIFKDFKGKDLLLKVSIHRKNRSNRQNRYIWGVVVPTVQAWFKETAGESYEREEIYTWLRTNLIDQKVEIREVDGVEVPVIPGKRFSQMNTKEFAEAIDEIIKKMDSRGCYIPLPKGENTLTEHIEDD